MRSISSVSFIITLTLTFIISGCDNTSPPTSSSSNQTSNQTIDGLYFNAPSQQLLFIDTQATHNPVVIHNYYSIVSHYQLVYLSQLSQPVKNNILGEKPNALFDKADNLAITRANSSSVILDMRNSRLLNSLIFDRLTMETDLPIQMTEKFDGAGATYTIRNDLSYSIELSSISKNCQLNGQLIDSGRGYWKDDNAELSAACDDETFEPGHYRTIAYTYWLTNEQGKKQRYLSAVSIPVDTKNSQPLWGGIEID